MLTLLIDVDAFPVKQEIYRVAERHLLNPEIHHACAGSMDSRFHDAFTGITLRNNTPRN
jgi:hypothetical protein